MPSSFTITMNVNIPPQLCNISVFPNAGVELIDLFLIEVKDCQDVEYIFTYRFAYYQS